MNYRKFLYYPGIDAYDDIHILDINNSKEINYEHFKSEIGENIKRINFNYPNELIKLNILNYQIFTFTNNNLNVIFSRTTLAGLDSYNRHIPITEVLILPHKIPYNKIMEEINFIYPLNFTNLEWPKINKVEQVSNQHQKRYKNINAIQNWDMQLVDDINFIVNCYHSGAISGISACFNEKSKSIFNSYTFYTTSNQSISFKSSSIVITILILLTILFFLFL